MHRLNSSEFARLQSFQPSANLFLIKICILFGLIIEICTKFVLILLGFVMAIRAKSALILL